MGALGSLASTTDLSRQPKTPSTPLAARGWQLTALESTTAEENMELDSEIQQLEEVLNRDVAVWEKRLGEVNDELKGRAT